MRSGSHSGRAQGYTFRDLDFGRHVLNVATYREGNSSIAMTSNARGNLFRNIGGTWLGIGADAVTGFLLTRIVLHAVGDSSFGLWVLVSGLLGYYGLLDLGTRNAVIRFVARHNAQKDFENLSRVLSTALAAYFAIGVAVLLLACAFAWRLQDLFTFQAAQDLADGKRLVLILGVGAAVGFPLSAFGGALEGLQQFVRIGVVQASASISRAIAVVIFLRLGYGIVAVGVITVLFNIAAGLVNAAFVFERFTQVKVALVSVRRETLVTLAGFGVVTFWVSIANRLRFESDSLVIGNLIGLQMVAIFAIGAKLIAYSNEVVSAMAGVFTPILSHADALGDDALLTKMTFIGNYYASLLAFPITTTLLFFGKQVIALWVGAQYALSYDVLAILAVPMAIYVSQSGSTRMLYGKGLHKSLAKLLFFEGVANLVLSILLARRFGIIGVAWGTAIPLLVTSLIALPWLACRALGTTVVKYWGSAQVPALVTVAPLIALFGVLWLVNPDPSVTEGLMELAAGAALYAAMTLNKFRKPSVQLAH
jgi:O-antigen/teichoic acid export membrane protein